MSTQSTPPKTIIVTAADAKYFGLLRGMVNSILSVRPNSDCAIGCFDLGLEAEQLDWLTSQGVQFIVPTTQLRHGVTSELQGKLGYLARPYLRENFPGHDIYIWMDSDIWLQDWRVVEQLIAGAAAKGGAFVRENAPEYHLRPDLMYWRARNFIRGYGVVTGLRVFLEKHINNGVFALHAQAPHWDHWRGYYQAAIDRCGRYAPFDQFGLNCAVYLRRLPVEFLSPVCNWICDLRMPIWNERIGRFARPRAPDEAISVMHLAGPAKAVVARIKTTTGAELVGGLRFDDERRLTSDPAP